MTRQRSPRGNLAGRRYVEYGQPVEVLISWRVGTPADVLPVDPPAEGWAINLTFWSTHARTRTGPRNVLIRRADGDLVVRPFRGLRLPPEP